MKSREFICQIDHCWGIPGIPVVDQLSECGLRARSEAIIIPRAREQTTKESHKPKSPLSLVFSVDYGAYSLVPMAAAGASSATTKVNVDDSKPVETAKEQQKPAAALEEDDEFEDFPVEGG